MVSHMKAEFPHNIVPGVIGPHRGKYLENLLEVLINGALIDWVPLGGERTLLGAIRKDLV